MKYKIEKNSVHSFREYSGRINVSCTVFISILYFISGPHTF